MKNIGRGILCESDVGQVLHSVVKMGVNWRNNVITFVS